jgi:hypothetical protein
MVTASRNEGKLIVTWWPSRTASSDGPCGPRLGVYGFCYQAVFRSFSTINWGVVQLRIELNQQSESNPFVCPIFIPTILTISCIVCFPAICKPSSELSWTGAVLLRVTGLYGIPDKENLDGHSLSWGVNSRKLEWAPGLQPSAFGAGQSPRQLKRLCQLWSWKESFRSLANKTNPFPAVNLRFYKIRPKRGCLIWWRPEL